MTRPSLACRSNSLGRHRGGLGCSAGRCCARPVLLLATLRVHDHFRVSPKKRSLFGTHYSGLCWFEGELWVLCRQHRVVLKVNPRTHAVLGEFDYRAIEDELGYRTGLPVGIMEGLAVSRDHIWIVTDNNGDGRGSGGGDNRPTLVRCRRPDLK